MPLSHLGGRGSRLCLGESGGVCTMSYMRGCEENYINRKGEDVQSGKVMEKKRRRLNKSSCKGQCSLKTKNKICHERVVINKSRVTLQ